MLFVIKVKKQKKGKVLKFLWVIPLDAISNSVVSELVYFIFSAPYNFTVLLIESNSMEWNVFLQFLEDAEWLFDIAFKSIFINNRKIIFLQVFIPNNFMVDLVSSWELWIFFLVLFIFFVTQIFFFFVTLLGIFVFLSFLLDMSIIQSEVVSNVLIIVNVFSNIFFLYLFLIFHFFFIFFVVVFVVRVIIETSLYHNAWCTVCCLVREGACVKYFFFVLPKKLIW